jgi:hypothetical protein
MPFEVAPPILRKDHNISPNIAKTCPEETMREREHESTIG